MNNNLIIFSIFFVGAIFTSENPSRSPESNNTSSTSTQVSSASPIATPRATPRSALSLALQRPQENHSPRPNDQKRPDYTLSEPRQKANVRPKTPRITTNEKEFVKILAGIQNPGSKEGFEEIKHYFLKARFIGLYLRSLNSELIHKGPLEKALRDFFREKVQEKNVKAVRALITYGIFDESLLDGCISLGITNKDEKYLEIAKIINPEKTAEALIKAFIA